MALMRRDSSEGEAATSVKSRIDSPLGARRALSVYQRTPARCCFLASVLQAASSILAAGKKKSCKPALASFPSLRSVFA